MKGEWCFFSDWLSKETCEDIVQKALQLPSQQGVLGVSGETSDSSYRRSVVRFINKDNPDFAFLFDMLWKAALWANDDYFSFHISKLDYLQFAEYDSEYQGEYKSHHDVFWLNGDPTYHRKLSCIIQLSDPADYDGGNLEMLEAGTKPDVDAIRNQGCMIFFPSFSRHQATQVTRGKRYSIAAWFDGPKWR